MLIERTADIAFGHHAPEERVRTEASSIEASPRKYCDHQVCDKETELIHAEYYSTRHLLFQSYRREAPLPFPPDPSGNI